MKSEGRSRAGATKSTGCRSRPDVDDRDKPGHDGEGDAFLQSTRCASRPASWTALPVMTGLVPVIHVVVYNRGPGAERAPRGLRAVDHGPTWMTGTSPVMTVRDVACSTAAVRAYRQPLSSGPRPGESLGGQFQDACDV